MSEAEAMADWDEPSRRGGRKKREPKLASLSPVVRITSPGFYDLAEAEYHADPIDGGSLSQSGAKLLLKSPAKYRWERDHPSPRSASMNLGTAAHRLVLGRGAPVVTVPENLLSDDGGVRSAEARAWKAAAIAAGKTVVSAAELMVITAMADALRRHPLASELLTGEGIAERSMFWRDEATGIWRRGLIDWTTARDGGPILVDYKTAADAAPDAFSRAVHKFGYHQQDDWYRAGYATLTGTDPDFLFIVQETSAPYLVAVYRLDAYAQQIGAVANRRAIDLYARCTKTGTWPGYDEGVTLLALPPWAEREYEMEVA